MYDLVFLLLPLPAPTHFQALSSSCSLPLLLLPPLMPGARTPEPGPQLPHPCRGVASVSNLSRPVQPWPSVDLIFFSGSFGSAGHYNENPSPAQSILIQCSHRHLPPISYLRFLKPVLTPLQQQSKLRSRESEGLACDSPAPAPGPRLASKKGQSSRTKVCSIIPDCLLHSLDLVFSHFSFAEFRCDSVSPFLP